MPLRGEGEIRSGIFVGVFGFLRKPGFAEGGAASGFFQGDAEVFAGAFADLF